MKYYIGVDIGSVATKVVLIKKDSKAEFIGGKISPTGSNGNLTSQKLIDDLIKEKVWIKMI